MHSIIALPKEINDQSTKSTTQLIKDTATKQTNSNFLSKIQSTLSSIIPKLTGLGFFELLSEGFIEQKQTTIDNQNVHQTSTLDEQDSSFETLDYLGAIIINSGDNSKIKKAQKTLDDAGYETIPDVQLTMQKPTSFGQEFRRRKTNLLPEESGISVAHNNGITGQGVLVGVLDTGCDADHIQFRRKQIEFRYVPPNYDEKLRNVRGFDVDGHGTHVCGIIAGEKIGVAPDVDLMVASVIESESYRTSLKRITVALNWMLSEIQRVENRNKPIIINMSLGFKPEFISKEDHDYLMIGIQELIRRLVEVFDILVVAAIGNDSSGNMCFPGYIPETLSVGAIDFNNNAACFSGGGTSPIDNETQPNIAGYGVDVFSSLERNSNNRSIYKQLSGTSMASPYVAGIAALYASSNSELYGEKLRQHLLKTALPLNENQDRVGAGLARYIPDGNEKI
ncbi:S8/S53 family peptidase [Candidatus Poribacteria bacterium]|nr:S8/S53 family peptidase [Candidatus Poribacteria bacterium]